VGAVAAIDWGVLRQVLAAAKIEPLPGELLDVKDEAAGPVTAALATAIGALGAEGGQSVWRALPLSGDADGFRTAIAAGLAAETAGWTAQAVTGRLVDDGAAFYMEPDINAARRALAATGAEG
jgi:hypothetical protein